MCRHAPWSSYENPPACTLLAPVLRGTLSGGGWGSACAGVRYVVDAGRVKERVLDSAGAAARYAVAWTSKASALQRAGRAGRTGPGHCYRRAHCAPALIL